MPSSHRDRSAPAPDRPRLVRVRASIEVDGSVLVDRRFDEGAWAFLLDVQAATPVRDVYLAFDGTRDRVTQIRGTTTLVGLLGWPTSHSLSPPMQNAGFEALGLDWAYVPLPTPPDLLPDAVRGLSAIGFAGANVTIPHKQAVIELCDELDDVARAAGSVNTLVFDDGRVLGSSTDGDAVTAQIDASRSPCARARLGWCRTCSGRGARARGRGGDDGEPSRVGLAASGAGYDVLVNATPVKEELIVAPHESIQVVDLAYLPDGRDRPS